MSRANGDSYQNDDDTSIENLMKLKNCYRFISDQFLLSSAKILHLARFEHIGMFSDDELLTLLYEVNDWGLVGVQDGNQITDNAKVRLAVLSSVIKQVHPGALLKVRPFLYEALQMVLLDKPFCMSAGLPSCNEVMHDQGNTESRFRLGQLGVLAFQYDTKLQTKL